MTGILYKITNTINDKIYIGITYRQLDKRWEQHKASVRAGQTSKIYNAMRDMGIDKFSIHEIGRFEQGDLEEAETRYITELNTVNNGYNTRYGGYSPYTISRDKYNDIVNSLKSGEKQLVDLSEIHDVSMAYLQYIAKKENIEIQANNQSNSTNKAVQVVCIDMQANWYKSFSQMHDAWVWLQEHRGKSIKQGHFYYQVRYAIKTGKIAYQAYWYTQDHIVQRLSKGQNVCLSIRDENIDCNKLYDTGLKINGRPVLQQDRKRFYMKIDTKMINKPDSYINKHDYYIINSDSYINNHDSYKDRQVPENLKIQYPFIESELQQLYPKYTANSIANHVGVQYTTVNKYLKRFGLK